MSEVLDIGRAEEALNLFNAGVAALSNEGVPPGDIAAALLGCYLQILCVATYTQHNEADAMERAFDGCRKALPAVMANVEAILGKGPVGHA